MRRKAGEYESGFRIASNEGLDSSITGAGVQSLYNKSHLSTVSATGGAACLTT